MIGMNVVDQSKRKLQPSGQNRRRSSL